jgi:hypothetical protein
MTSPHTTIYTPFADGRPVRDIVEHTPALVDETWCRNLLRHTLDSLEQQYASGAPHRAITPDTLVTLENGDALLLPSAGDASATPDLPADLHALALVVHYAITAELPPEGPLGPRLYENYSGQLTKGLDCCLGPNRRLRPKTVEEMRALLGIEAGAVEEAAPAVAVKDDPVPFAQSGTTAQAAALAAPLDNPVPEPTAMTPHDAPDPLAAPPGPAGLREKTEARMLRKPASPDTLAAGPVRAPRSAPMPAPLPDSADPAPAAPYKPAAAIPVGAPRSAAQAQAQAQPSRRRNSRAQRWGMFAGAALVVLAAGSALVSYMQQNDARDLVPLTLPPSERAATGLDTGEAIVAPAAGAIGTDQPTGAAADGAAGASGMVASGVPPTAAQATGSPNVAIINGTTYKLVIKPWGTLYVNGVDHGVSPPVKRLTLGPGRHTIVIANPNFAEHTMTIDAGVTETAIIEHDFRVQAQ